MAGSSQESLQTALGGSYTIERVLGRGGMAVVYLARDNKHQRLVALKVLEANLAASLGPERFRREITTAAQLQHPHILGVFDSGETADGQLWFTMPYVEGESLRERLRREHQLPLESVLRITREIADALDYAHDSGVIHRDIKPENILLTKRGDALLADFGIARALADGSATGETPSIGLTMTGLSVGTPQYMSPEQAAGERMLDARSDVYALGTVVYEMLAGEPPFSGPSQQAVIAKMLSTDAPSVRVLRPGITTEMDAALARALARVPADRWPSAGAFEHAFAAGERTAQTAAAAAPAPVTVRNARRRVPLSVLTLGLGFVIGIGLLFAWRSRSAGSAGTTPSGATRLAVLPFENEGDSADAYFADGMTEAVHDKLTGLPGLEVVGSTSSRQYRGTTKTPQQIGQELGVRYILEGRVRWAKGPNGASRVRVAPELIDANSANAKWAQPFDAPLTDVFQVQGDIAGKVAQALQVALTPAAQQTLAERPTKNLLAYDAYLRGLAYRGNSPLVLRRAIAAYREAVIRDSTFGLAWSRLGQAYSLLYFNALALNAYADSADKATARGLALSPQLPQAHTARANYYSSVRGDLKRALEEIDAGLAHGSDVTLLSAAANAEASSGNWDAAAARAAQAVDLDPRDPSAYGRAGEMALFRHKTDQARALYAKARAVTPDDLYGIELSAMTELQLGDLPAAQAILRNAPPTVDRAALVAYVAEYWDLGWILDSAQESLLLSLRSDAFDDDDGVRTVVMAQQYYLRGDSSRMRAYADSAVKTITEQIQRTPDDDGRRVARGIAYALLGLRAEAVADGEKSIAIRPTSKDAQFGPYNEHQLARIYTITGQQDLAIDLLQKLLAEPYYLSPAWLRIDPNFAPLRSNPRFQQLIGTKSKPVT